MLNLGLAIEIFKSIGKEISTPYIERECVAALQSHDGDWLEHLYFACNCLNIKEEDFTNKTFYKQMKKIAEEPTN